MWALEAAFDLIWPFLPGSSPQCCCCWLHHCTVHMAYVQAPSIGHGFISLPVSWLHHFDMATVPIFPFPYYPIWLFACPLFGNLWMAFPFHFPCAGILCRGSLLPHLGGSPFIHGCMLYGPCVHLVQEGRVHILVPLMHSLLLLPWIISIWVSSILSAVYCITMCAWHPCLGYYLYSWVLHHPGTLAIGYCSPST